MACVAAAGARAGEGLREIFKDPEDSRLDASQWLVGRRRFLPVPLVITESAVGYGGGLALAFFWASTSRAGPRSGLSTFRSGAAGGSSRLQAAPR